MKKIKIWSMMMLVAMVLPMMVACGGDDDNNNNNNLSYTSDEIVELLTGTWAIQGEYRCAENENTTNAFHYTAQIQFKANKSFQVKNLTIDETKATVFLSNYHGYEIIKKEGKTYITFVLYENIGNGTAYRKEDFQIVSLNKNSFQLIYENSSDNRYEFFSIISM